MASGHWRNEYEYKVTAMTPADVAETADDHLNFYAEGGWRLVEVIILPDEDQASFIWERKRL